MRMRPNLTTYWEVIREHLATLESRENAAMHNGGLVYVRRVPRACARKGARAGSTSGWTLR